MWVQPLVVTMTLARSGRDHLLGIATVNGDCVPPSGQEAADRTVGPRNRQRPYREFRRFTQPRSPRGWLASVSVSQFSIGSSRVRPSLRCKRRAAHAAPPRPLKSLVCSSTKLSFAHCASAAQRCGSDARREKLQISNPDEEATQTAQR